MNKKGLSLIEVVVALSILMVVFSGTVTLIITVVNLSVSAREKTEATTYGQKALAEGIKQISFGCRKDLPDNDFGATYASGKYTAVVHYDYVTEAEGNFAIDPEGNFMKVTSVLTWNDRFGNLLDYKITQIVGRD